MNKQIRDKVIVNSPQSIIKTEVNISTKDRFKTSKQASDLNWYNQSIMAKKTDTIFQQNDPNWEDVNSEKELLPPSAGKSKKI